MTLIDVVVGVSIMVIVFFAIFGAFRLAIDLVFSTKAKTGAVALVTEQMEYIRSLGYDSVGTVGGIPAGPIVQVQQKALNGIPYTITTLVQYVDDPADGTGNADTNHITADYKIVKVTADWLIRTSPRTTFAVTKIAPHGIETLGNGGTLRVNVFDALTASVSGATVRIINASTNPTIDVSVDTSSAGSVEFPGAPAAGGYQVTVTKPGYSTAQTYSATAGNPNPNPGHVAVVNKQTSTISFAIDTLASLSVASWNPIASGSFTDPFTGVSQLSATSSTVVSGSSLRLEGSAPTYPANGTAMSVAIAPAYLANWSSLSWHASTSASASALVSLYYLTSNGYALVPQNDLPGNSAGFSASPVDLSALLVATYPDLRIGAALSTSDPSITPEILDWTLSYTAGPTPLPNVAFSLRGTKTIGTTGGGASIYKMSGSYATDQYAQWATSTLEWDTYVLTLPSGSPYTIIEQCPDALSLSPAGSVSQSLTLVNAVANSLRLSVLGNGNPLQNASITVIGGSTNVSGSTSSCGQAFFALPSGSYTVTISAAGYQTDIENAVSVSGSSVLSVSLAPL